MMLLHVEMVRLWILLLITGTLPNFVVSHRASWQIVGRTAVHREKAHRASWPIVGDGTTHSISSLKNCSERYNIKTCPLQKSKHASVFKACDMEKSNGPVIIKAFTSKKEFNREAMSFYLLAWGREIYKAGRTEGSAAAANAKTSPWNHFVELLDRCNHEGQPALVIEFLDKELLDVIELQPITMSTSGCEASEGLAAMPSQQLQGGYPVSQFKWYAYQLVRAVAALHEVGIAHLDVKPDNIGLTPDDTLKLFDFQTVCTTRPRKHVGTIEYLAPEMNLLWPDRNGDKMDVWSLACTIYEIFTGEQLFGAIWSFAELNTLSPVAPKKNCSFAAAYFYIIWSLGMTTYDKYEAYEKGIKITCPQIFADKSKEQLKIHSPRVFATAYPEECGRKELTYIEFKFYQRICDESILVTRIEPSGTAAHELVPLLNNMLQLDGNVRISAHSALTKYSIFKEYL